MLNVPICTQGMQRAWWPEAGIIIVTGPYSLNPHVVVLRLCNIWWNDTLSFVTRGFVYIHHLHHGWYVCVNSFHAELFKWRTNIARLLFIKMSCNQISWSLKAATLGVISISLLLCYELSIVRIVEKIGDIIMALLFISLTARQGLAADNAGISTGMYPANERRCYTVTYSLIGWTHT